MRSIELINSVLAKKSDETETKQTDELKQAIDKLDTISATMEGIFNKLSTPTETPKKTKAKKTDVEETEDIKTNTAPATPENNENNGGN